MAEKAQTVVSKEAGGAFSISKIRQRNYANRRRSDKMSGGAKHNHAYWNFARELGSVIIAHTVIFGPLERSKICLQVNPLVKYANPKVDRPKNFFDLCAKVNNNQGMFAFYRGSTAYVYKLCVQHFTRFFIYENFVGALAEAQGKHQQPSFGQTVAAATASGVFTTLVAYPLDLAHGKMAADMSKKPALGLDNR